MVCPHGVWEGEREEPSQEVRFFSEAAFIEHCLVHYSCPTFAGDPHSAESVALKKDYLLTREKVLTYYKDKDFLEATLSLLAGYRP